MEIYDAGKLKKNNARHRLSGSRQTGFPSPATHYEEPQIDLHDVLLRNRDATFYVRVKGDAYADYNIYDKDVLIIDRSVAPKRNALALVVVDGAFTVVRLPHEGELWGVVTYIIHAAL